MRDFSTLSNEELLRLPEVERLHEELVDYQGDDEVSTVPITPHECTLAPSVRSDLDPNASSTPDECTPPLHP